jgi:hypothetical protein
MHYRAAVVVVEQMLAPSSRAPQHLTVNRVRREAALWTRNRHRRTGITSLMQPGKSVQGMPFGHGGYPAGAPGTGGGWWVRSYSSRMSIRRWWRSAFDHGVVKNASTNVRASGTVCMRPPMPIS